MEILSLPSRERGLKSALSEHLVQRGKSLPSRERGLKFLRLEVLDKLRIVAPFAGAWIEFFWPA